jgi:two-component system sensor histidine kinase RstB
LGLTFNSLIDRIQGLVRAQQHVTQAVAHDLRTPLARLKFRLEMLREQESDDDKLQLMTGIARDCDALSVLVDEVLHYARLEADGVVLTFETCDIAALLDEIVAEFRVDCVLTIALVVPKNAIRAACNVQQLRHAVINLLQNAARYGRSLITVQLFQESEVCVIAISNDGPPLSESIKERLFEPFVRAAQHHQDHTGFGLGLAIVKRTMAVHGGEVSVTTGDSGGPCFQLRWPCVIDGTTIKT